MKKILLVLFLLLFVSGCNINLNQNNNDNNDKLPNQNQQEENPDNTQTEGSVITNTYGEFSISSVVKDAYSKNADIITFTKPGEYTVSGTLNGSLAFSKNIADSVTLYLNSAKITSEDYHAIFWMSDAGKIEIKAMENTVNEITINAKGTNLFSAIESENNIEIGGSGKLAIKANQRHAIKGSNITVKGNVDLTIEAVKDGLHGKQIIISGGNTKINNCTDALQAEINSSNLKGTILIEEGILTIENCKRAFRATTSVTIEPLTGLIVTVNVNHTQILHETLGFNVSSGTLFVDGTQY